MFGDRIFDKISRRGQLRRQPVEHPHSKMYPAADSTPPRATARFISRAVL